MPDYDMSQSACVARATRQKEHDQMLKDIKELTLRMDTILSIIINFHPEVLDGFNDYLKEHPDA